MSLSQPNDNAPNPATRWFEWNGKDGCIKYYDKDTDTKVDLPLPFAFSLLDELASVRGWHKLSTSGIYSNQVRDTSKDTLIVKSFKGGLLAEGLYKDIKADINAAGGKYNADLYIAFKNENGELVTGGLLLKGTALKSWMDFRKQHGDDRYRKAIVIADVSDGKNGNITFKTPIFQLQPRSAESTNVAKALDVKLQDWLTGYFRRNKRDQTNAAAEAPAPQPEPELVAAGSSATPPVEVFDDDIPFSWALPLVLPALALLGGVLA